MSDEENKNEEDIEYLRQKNLEERNAFLSSVMKEADFARAVNAINKLSDQRTTAKPVSKRRSNGDSVFRFTGAVPLERRNSARLQNKKPLYDYNDLPDEKPVSAVKDGSLEDLEEVVFEVKKARKSYGRRPSPPRLPVEEVTEAMIKNIHLKGNKVYGENATSCHQCRQKTIDQKTVCRSGVCVGIRGQYCGICVVNRYGEDPAEALRNPTWRCYVCRGCCNCSFCRAKAGKRPTGILAPIAVNNGFKSVHDFLLSLNGYGDYEKSDDDDPENLLGFDKVNAVLVGNKKISLTCDHDSDILKNMNAVASSPVEKKKQKKKPTFKIRLGKTLPENDPKNLLGFDCNEAVMGGNKKIKLHCKFDDLPNAKSVTNQ